MNENVPRWTEYLETASMLSDALAHARAHDTLETELAQYVRRAANYALAEARDRMPRSVRQNPDHRGYYNSIYLAVNRNAAPSELIEEPKAETAQLTLA